MIEPLEEGISGHYRLGYGKQIDRERSKEICCSAFQSVCLISEMVREIKVVDKAARQGGCMAVWIINPFSRHWLASVGLTCEIYCGTLISSSPWSLSRNQSQNRNH